MLGPVDRTIYKKQPPRPARVAAPGGVITIESISTSRFLVAVVGCLLVAAAPAIGAESETAGLRLVVRDAVTGRAPDHALYVGVVAEGFPYDAPVLEAEIEPGTGGALTTRLPAGRYHLVAAAEGYAPVYLPSFVLEAARPAEQIITLEPLVTTRGRVVGGEGQPLAGAHIGSVHAFVIDAPRRLSALGARFLSQAAQSGDDGRFVLPRPAGRVPLWVEAAGHEPRWVNEAQADDAPLTVRLAPGASLSLEVTGSPARGWQRLQLDPVDRAFVDALPLRPAELLWSRPLAELARWRSLPAGVYDLVVAGVPGDGWASPRAVLGRVELRPGEHQHHTVRLPALHDPPPLPSGRSLRVLLPDLWPSQLGQVEAVIAAGEEEAPRPLPVRTRPVTGGTALELAGGCVEGARMRLAGDEQVAVSDLLTSPCALVRLEALPRADLTATLRPPAGGVLPPGGALQLEACPDAEGTAHEHVVPLAIAADGTVRVPVPSGCHHTVLEVGSFARLDLGALAPPVGATRDLGRLALSWGGTLEVDVADQATQLPVEGVAVLVRAADAHTTSPGRPPMRITARSTIARAVTDADGRARLEHLPPGMLRVVLAVLDRPWSVEAAEVEITAGESTHARLVLPGGGAIDVSLVLAAALDDAVKLVDVVATRAAFSDSEADAREMLRSPITAERTAALRDVPAGRWRLEVLGRASGAVQPLGQIEVDVEAGETTQTELVLEPLRFTGRMTYGEQPVMGQLHVAPQAVGETAVRARLDVDGRFALILPTAGERDVDVLVEAFAERVRVPAVDFARPEAEIEIRLPAGQVSGIVRDAHGQVVDRAHVRALSPRGGRSSTPAPPRQAQTDRTGRFVLDLLPGGRLTLRARSPDGARGSATVDLATGGVRKDLEIVVAPTRKLGGQVIATDGTPVPNASVRAMVAPVIAGAMPANLHARTGADGHFVLDVDTAIAGAHTDFVVDAPGYGLVITRRVLEGGLLVELPPPAAAVDLRLTGSHWQDWPPWSLPFRLVAEDGGSMQLSTRGGAVLAGDALRLRGLAPGRYSVVTDGALAAHRLAFTATIGEPVEIVLDLSLATP